MWVSRFTLILSLARNGAVIRADVHVGPDGRPKGSGIVAFESADDARNAIQQFNGYDWQGRPLEVREDRFAGSGPGFGGRGGFGARGGFGGGFGGRGGGFGARGGFGGGFGSARGGGGFGGGGGGYQGAGGFDGGAGAVAAVPNPFTDYATSGTDRSETIYVRNVSLLPFSWDIYSNELKSFLGLLATRILLNSLPPLERSSKRKSNTNPMAVPVAPV